jgi:hypothetical protein
MNVIMVKEGSILYELNQRMQVFLSSGITEESSFYKALEELLDAKNYNKTRPTYLLVEELSKYFSNTEYDDKIDSLKYLSNTEHDGIKADDGKIAWDLISLKELEPMLRVLMFGANKYSKDNWQKVPDGKTRYYNALMRHLSSYAAGELIDSESGESHLAHALCNLYFLNWFNK